MRPRARLHAGKDELREEEWNKCERKGGSVGTGEGGREGINKT